MKRLFLALFLVVLAAPLAAAGDSEFGSLVREVESRLGVRRVHIPLFGVATFFVRVAHPSGVNRLEMAVFEKPAQAPDDDLWFEDAMRSALGARWSTMLRVQERRNGERTYLCARPEGKHWKLILATFDRDDVVLMQLRVNPEVLLASLDEPRQARYALSGRRQD